MSDIEISLDAEAPLSKKELRRIKKGKTTLEEIQKKKAKKLAKAAQSGDNKSQPVSVDKSESTDSTATPNTTTTTTTSTTFQPAKRSNFGVWIGNLSFETTRDELTNFFISKMSIEKSDIARVNLPTRGSKNRGFAYVDFFTEDHLNSAIGLSESELNTRKVLIKNANSYEGRPEKASATANASKNPPSRILFVGNLSFDTTETMLRDHFNHCGEIVKIRMATFEDSGKCKGFAFIDFKDIEGPTAALKDRNCKKLIGRPLRMEFGEDRSQRKVVPKDSTTKHEIDTEPTIDSSNVGPSRGFQAKNDRPAKRHQPQRNDVRLTSSVALANAPRQSAAIVKSTGKKISFD
ncbi:hypothetical protein CANINC_002125 [Pichia inconspicua]|uniref:RRM domain-containing protein n=1 Tax=Pichia inconspicua TaxID=52247 RepID=A0A4T0X1Y6_9ASCO|nr:hypothetical protein CANINC_002125 [[Candida] inconspicua]